MVSTITYKDFIGSHQLISIYINNKCMTYTMITYILHALSLSSYINFNNFSVILGIMGFNEQVNRFRDKKREYERIGIKRVEKKHSREEHYRA